MQAIVTPEPDPPITLTPLPQLDEPPPRWRRHWRIAAAGLAGLTLGVLLARPAPAAPDVESSLGWMFDAALAHEAVDESGNPVGAAADNVRVVSVDIVDPTAGPVVARVDVDGRQVVYQIVVERDGVGWRVSAVELAG